MLKERRLAMSVASEVMGYTTALRAIKQDEARGVAVSHALKRAQSICPARPSVVALGLSRGQII